MKKKWIGIALCLVLVFTFAGCGGSDSEGAYEAGTYTATADGHNGEVTVEVEFDESSIVRVDVLEHSESDGISDPAIEKIPAGVVEHQSLAVDSVSGATVTSEALKAAIEDCVTQAGGDVEALKNKEVSESEGEDVELDVDVVVAGAGGTGLAAAASAHENGAEVLVLEKMANTGGSTALSGGGISATGSKFQEERGIEDSKESWMELWKERQATSNPDSQFPDYERVDYFMDEAIVTTEWLVDYVGHSYGDISGFGLDPVERLHFPEGGGGSVLTGNIEQFLRDEGVEIRTETEVTEIIVDDEGNAVGVLAQGPDGKVTVNAKKVILATGGYARSEEMLEKYIPEAVGTADLSAAAAGTTGDGMVMTEKLDAAVYEEPWVIGLGVATKVEGTSSLMMDWSKLYVNGNGERFTNEQIHYAIATNRILEADNPWIIIDSAEENAELVQALEAGLDTGEVVRGESVEALAEEMGVPVDTFVDTIETYNAGAQNGNDEFGKTEDFLKPVENSPFYAIKAYGKTMGTFAGVEINDNMQVLREDGSIIGNLYAGGEMANKALYNQVYMSGSAVQWALTSGRLAGEHAATNLQ